MRAVIGACLAAVLCLPLVVGCKTTPGATSSYSDWHDISMSESVVDIPLFIADAITRTERRYRNNATIQNRYHLQGNGRIVVEHLTSHIFRETVAMKLNDEETFLAELPDDVEGLASDLGVPVRIHHPRAETAGYFVRFTRTSDSGSCLYAYGGYKFGHTGAQNDAGNLDTVILLVSCGDPTVIDRLVAMLSEVSTVEDREEFRASVPGV